MLNKALIVDDSRESRMLLRRILTTAFGVHIIEAEHGKDALVKLAKEKPDVVFLDYEMPVMNGKETLKAIRSIDEYRNLPVVMVTSHDEMDLVRELLSYKVSAYLIKPISADYVVKRLSIIFPESDENH
jgi:CheY-like chemotaxis protein